MCIYSERCVLCKGNLWVPWCTYLICIAIYICHEGGLCVGAVSNIWCICLYIYISLEGVPVIYNQASMGSAHRKLVMCMYLCIDLYIYTYTYLAPNLQTYPYIVLVHVCIIVYVYIYNHSLKQVRFTARFFAKGHDDTCVFSVCNYIYMCIYIYIYSDLCVLCKGEPVSAKGSCFLCTASCGYCRPLSRYQLRFAWVTG